MPIMFGKSCLPRISTNVLHYVPKVILISQNAIVGFLVPKWSGSRFPAIDFSGSYRLDGADQVLELNTAEWPHDQVHVIGHHREAPEFVVNLVRMHERVNHLAGIAWLT